MITVTASQTLDDLPYNYKNVANILLAEAANYLAMVGLSCNDNVEVRCIVERNTDFENKSKKSYAGLMSDNARPFEALKNINIVPMLKVNTITQM